MALPPEDLHPSEPSEPPETARPELRLIEASDARERTCAECGRRTASWKPVRRKGAAVILCLECATKPPQEEGGPACPECGTALRPGDAFCGKCGTRIEYACPTCGEVLEVTDAFCGRCGTRVA